MSNYTIAREHMNYAPEVIVTLTDHTSRTGRIAFADFSGVCILTTDASAPFEVFHWASVLQVVPA